MEATLKSLEFIKSEKKAEKKLLNKQKELKDLQLPTARQIIT